VATNALRRELFKLSAAERLELVEELWDSIAAEAERNADVLPLTDGQKEELDRRIAAHRADPSRVVPWEEVRKELWRERK
jgi:putative addiction module component (TIGR02574 family)